MGWLELFRFCTDGRAHTSNDPLAARRQKKVSVLNRLAFGVVGVSPLM
jgi:hypothetical protein